MAPRKVNKSARSSLDSDAADMEATATNTAPGSGHDYLAKRAKNNEAVKRSREKQRQKAKETSDRVKNLKSENLALESKVKLLAKELEFLKSIFLAHTGSAPAGISIDNMDADLFLNDESSPDAGSAVDDISLDNLNMGLVLKNESGSATPGVNLDHLDMSLVLKNEPSSEAGSATVGVSLDHLDMSIVLTDDSSSFEMHQMNQ